jgi:peptidoglycan/LPS O-acetylase OafA/YrhL
MTAGFFLFDHLSYRDLTKSAFTSSLSISNIQFWREVVYFDAPSYIKPLLHTWSLSVEEQLYLAYPILLLFINRKSQKWKIFVLAILGTASFVLFIIFSQPSPESAFYLMPSRAWEFIAGAMLLVSNPFEVERYKWNKVILISTVAIFLIFLFGFKSVDSFPYLMVMVAVAFAATLIRFGESEGNPINGFLTMKPLVYIGNHSFSIYLWHWPVFSFYRYAAMRDPQPTESVFLIAIVLLLSHLSFRFIEQPFRNKKDTSAWQWKSFSIAGSCAMVFVVTGLFTIKANGLPTRIPNSGMLDRSVDDSIWNNQVLWEQKAIIPGNDFQLTSIGVKNLQPSFIIWGDSHARSLFHGFDSLSRKVGLSGRMASMSATPPVLPGNVILGLSSDKINFNKRVLDEIKQMDGLQQVFLIPRWATYFRANGAGFSREKSVGGFWFEWPWKLTEVDDDQVEVFLDGLDSVANVLTNSGLKVFLVGPLPEMTTEPREWIGNHQLYHNFMCSTDTEIISDWKILDNEIFSMMNRRKSNVAHYISTSMAFPSSKGPEIISSGALNFRDKSHLSKDGALAFFLQLTSNKWPQ